MKLPVASNGASIPALPMGTSLTKVTVSDTSAASAAVSDDGTVRLSCSCAFHYSINAAGTDANENDPRLAADTIEYRAIASGDKVHAIQASGESGGDLTVEFIAEG